LFGFGCYLHVGSDNVWTPARRIWQRRDATRAPIRVPECRATAVALFNQTFWPESGKSQGFGDSVPIQVPLIITAPRLFDLAVSHSSGNILRNAYFPKETLFHD
jgi:hypothetical protein